MINMRGTVCCQKGVQMLCTFLIRQPELRHQASQLKGSSNMYPLLTGNSAIPSESLNIINWIERSWKEFLVYITGVNRLRYRVGSDCTKSDDLC
jgi:hypothetical protein